MIERFTNNLQKREAKMKNKIITLTIVLAACLMIISAGCETKKTKKPGDGIANPASVYCEDNGGKLEIVTDANGGQYGLCKLADGNICEEWDYFKGDCPKKLPADCGTCPQYSPPAPGFCLGGNIIDGGKNDCGCQLPPKCETVACTEEAKLCSDGSAVGRVGPNCEFAPCPKTAAEEKKYVVEDPEQCKVVKFMCIKGSKPFFDETGCGCEPENATDTQPGGKLKANDCTDPRPTACTKEYMPVCGWFSQSIKCFAYPCAQTFGNKCEACAAENIDYWTQGECPKVGSTP
jgi:uncharacterized protein